MRNLQVPPQVSCRGSALYFSLASYSLHGFDQADAMANAIVVLNRKPLPGAASQMPGLLRSLPRSRRLLVLLSLRWRLAGTEVKRLRSVLSSALSAYLSSLSQLVERVLATGSKLRLKTLELVMWLLYSACLNVSTRRTRTRLVYSLCSNCELSMIKNILTNRSELPFL
jgi:hypothetical protein